MSDDLPNQNDNNDSNTNAVPASPIGGPPPFGSSFTPAPPGQALLTSSHQDTNPVNLPVDFQNLNSGQVFIKSNLTLNQNVNTSLY